MEHRRIGWVWSLLVALVLAVIPSPVWAQEWPPFKFSMTPTHVEDRVTYALRLTDNGEGALTDLTIKVPLPAGTHYLEGGSLHPGVQVTFDGAEVTVFAAVVHRNLRDVSFSVAADDPAQTVFTTHAWIKWSGSQPGEYTTPDVTVDVTRPALTWTPSETVLDLQASALLAGDTITYTVRTRNASWMRMWDLVVNLQLPPGVEPVENRAPAGFTATPAEGQVSFKTIELSNAAEVEPLRVVGVVGAAVGTDLPAQVAAHWRNEGWDVGVTYPAEGQVGLSGLVARAGRTQLVVANPAGNVPLPHNDLTRVTFVPEVDALKVTLTTVGDSVAEQDPVEYALYLDVDCNPATGEPTAAGIGSDLRASAEPIYRGAYLEMWDQRISDWTLLRAITGHKPAAPGEVMLWIPREELPASGQLCWAAQTESWNSRRYDRYPPSDLVVSDPDTRIDLDGWAGRTDQPSSRVPPVGAELAPLDTLSLGASAMVVGNTITYSIRADNGGSVDINDLRIEMPLPPGTAMSITEATPPFVANILDGTVVFGAPRVAAGTQPEPLRVVLTASGDAPISVPVTASWQNTGWDVGIVYPGDGQASTADLIVQPGVDQMVVVDTRNNLPAAYYVLQGVTFAPEGEMLKIIFATAGSVLQANRPTEFGLYVDADCDPATGELAAGVFGSDYRVGAEPLTQMLYYDVWDAAAAAWQSYRPARAAMVPDRNEVVLWLPLETLPADRLLCWVAVSSVWGADADPALGSGYDEMTSTDGTRLDLSRWAVSRPAGGPRTGDGGAEQSPGNASEEPTLGLQLGALAQREAMTYSVFVANIGERERQDLAIDLPLPAGTDLTATELPEGFTATLSDDGTVEFRARNLAAQTAQLLLAGVQPVGQDAAQLSTRLSASWHDVGWLVDSAELPSGQAVTPELTVPVGQPQLAVVSAWNDAAPAAHDLVGMAFAPKDDMLEVVFRPAGDMFRSGKPVEFVWYVDADCDAATGDQIAEDIGAEFRAGGTTNADRLYFEAYDSATTTWLPYRSIRRGAVTDQAALWIPLDALPAGQSCWLADTFAQGEAVYPLSGDVRSNPATRLDLGRLAGESEG